MENKKTNITLYIDTKTKEKINDISKNLGIKKGKLVEIIFENLNENDILNFINKKINN